MEKMHNGGPEGKIQLTLKDIYKMLESNLDRLDELNDRAILLEDQIFPNINKNQDDPQLHHQPKGIENQNMIEDFNSLLKSMNNKIDVIGNRIDNVVNIIGLPE